MAGEGVNVGSIFGRLGFRFDSSGSQEFDRARQRHEQQTREPVEQELGFKVDQKALTDYHRELDKVKARAARREEFKTQLGVEYDSRAFRAYERELAKAERDAQRLEAQQLKLAVATNKTSREFGDGGKNLEAFAGGLRSLFNTSVKAASVISAVGVAVQTVSAAGAGLGGLAAGFAPLGGALAAYPALASSAAQGVGVLKLATEGLSDALGAASEASKGAHANAFAAYRGGSEEAKKYREELEKLNKPQQAFVRSIVEQLPLLKQAREDASQGLDDAAKGVTAAARNFDVIRPILRSTSDAIGGIVRQAGELVGSKGFGRDLQTQGERNVVWIQRAGDGGLNLANALRHVTLAAGPLVDWMTRGALRFTEFVEKQAEAGRESGRLASFFEQTRLQMSRVFRIAGDVGEALFNIGKLAYPLGTDLLKAITVNAEAFKDWTESAKGRNAIAEYFERARPVIDELGGLIVDITKAFFRLGDGDQAAPLIKAIRTEMLPALERVVEVTTESFGPALIDAITEALELFEEISGANGPLVTFVKVLGDVLNGINDIIDAVPGIGTVLTALITAGGLYGALRIAGALTGVSRLIGLLRTAKGEAAAVSIAGAGGAPVVTRGDPLAGNQGGRVRNTIGRAANSLPLIGTGVLLAMGWQEGREAKRDQADEKSLGRVRGALEGAMTDPKKWEDIANAIERLDKTKFLSGGAEQFESAKRGMEELGLSFDSPKRQIRDAAREFDKLQDRFQVTQDLLKHGISFPDDFSDNATEGAKKIRTAFDRVERGVSDSIREARTHVRTNMRLIKANLDEDSHEGRQALGANFAAVARSVKRGMDAGKIATDRGMREIRRLLTAELQLYGISLASARNIAKGDGKGGQYGDVDNNLGREGGAFATEEVPSAQHGRRAKGGWIRRAVGGWIGGRGMVSGDVVPLEPGVLAAYGEYDATGPGGRRAIVNRHQAPWIEAALALGGYPGLDHLPRGNQLGAIENAMAPFGGLDALFDSVRTPHHFARGGYAGVTGDTDFSPALGRALSAMARAAGQAIYVQSGKRTLAEQAALYASKGPGNAAAPGPNAPHVRGGAADITPGREIFGAMAARFGLGFTVGHEPWHIQLLNAAAGANAVLSQIPRVIVRGGGLIGTAAQGALNLARAGANRMLDRAAFAVPSGEGAPTGGGGAGEGQARAWIAAGLRLAGVPATAGNIATILGRARQESNLNPRAVNTWDINAQRGDPSRGFLQTIMSTFRRYMVRGHGDIWNPVDNTAAAVRYMMDRYGRLVGAGPGGYSLGGIVRRFAPGGRVSGPAKGLRPAGKGYETGMKGLGYGPGKIVVTKPRDGVDDYAGLAGQVEHEEKVYDLTERRYNQSNEQLLNDDGSLNPAAIRARVVELESLVKIRQRILELYRRMQRIAQRARAMYELQIQRLNGSLKHAKGKDRSGIKARIKEYTEALDGTDGWRDKEEALEFTVGGSELDVGDLTNEIAEVTGTKPNTDRSAAEPVGITPDQQAQLDHVDRLTEIIETGKFLEQSMLSTLNTFEPRGVGQAGFGAGAAGVFPGSRTGAVGAPQGSAPGTGSGFGGGPTIVFQFQSYVPPSPQQARELAGYVISGLQQQGAIPSTNQRVV